MGLLKTIAIVMALYVIFGTVWTFVKLSGLIQISSSNVLYDVVLAIDLFFMPIEFFLAFFVLPFIFPPPPVIF